MSVCTGANRGHIAIPSFPKSNFSLLHFQNNSNPWQRKPRGRTCPWDVFDISTDRKVLFIGHLFSVCMGLYSQRRVYTRKCTRYNRPVGSLFWTSRVSLIDRGKKLVSVLVKFRCEYISKRNVRSSQYHPPDISFVQKYNHLLCKDFCVFVALNEKD